LTLYKPLENPALIKALSHPLRRKILHVLQEQETSPKELALHFGLPLSNVAYHIQVLRKLKLIRLVRKTPRRGAIEHRYKADYGYNIDDAAWSTTPDLIKERTVAAALEEIGSYVTGAAVVGGFRADNARLTRSRLVLDTEAWDVIAERLKEVLELGDRLQKESAARLKRSNHEGERRAGLVTMLFEEAPSVPDPDATGWAAPDGHAQAAVAAPRVD
jgi:DNA-binding transcriptional ArsR family regulator